MTSTVVYTVVMGDFETLYPTKYPGICLTDSDLTPTKHWKLRKIEAEHPSSRRASRHPKMMPHKYFPEAEYTIYLDANIQLLEAPQTIVKDLLQTEDLALFAHPKRNCIYDEALKCIEYKKADSAIVEKQVEHYRSVGFPSEFGLTACWVIVRRNTPETCQFGEAWWKEYSRFSCRDQLSFDFVRWQLDMKYAKIPGDLFKGSSKYFQRGKHIR